jgi:hypothetical protein
LGVVSQGGGEVGGAGEMQDADQVNVLPSIAASLRPPRADGVVR